MHLLLLSPRSLNTLPNIVFSSSQRTRRVDLVEAISNLPEEDRTRLEQSAREKKSKIIVQPLVMNYPPSPYFSFAGFRFFITACFRRHCAKLHLQFIDETGNGATMTATCAICAGSFFLQALACCHRISFARNEQAAARSSSSCSGVN